MNPCIWATVKHEADAFIQDRLGTLCQEARDWGRNGSLAPDAKIHELRGILIKGTFAPQGALHVAQDLVADAAMAHVAAFPRCINPRPGGLS